MMLQSESEYLAFSDESGSGGDDFRGVGMVSGKRDSLIFLREKLDKILGASGFGSVEWKKTGDRRKTNVVKDLLLAGVHAAIATDVRIDVLIWNIRDRRHDIPGRDDIANLERMYYRLFVDLAQRRGRRHWVLYPDENGAIDWLEIAHYVNVTSIRKSKPGLVELFETSQERIRLVDVKPQVSSSEPLVQLADLFVGMARFCRSCSDLLVKLDSWRSEAACLEQISVLPQKSVGLSNSERCRLEILDAFDAACKAAKLGVSLGTREYLWTANPVNPVNFWHYEPQHDLDKAPTRQE